MDTPTGHELNADQIAYWNGPAGQRWADRQAALTIRQVIHPKRVRVKDLWLFILLQLLHKRGRSK